MGGLVLSEQWVGIEEGKGGEGLGGGEEGGTAVGYKIKKKTFKLKKKRAICGSQFSHHVGHKI